ncbi:MAG: flippase-like domain-containing protein [Chloroflexi bacterium]|nr:flippase-like domain-containing protein [Chloroflexota bacterium]
MAESEVKPYKPEKPFRLVLFFLQLLLGLFIFFAVVVSFSFDWRQLQGIQLFPLFAGFLLTIMIASSIGLRWHLILINLTGQKILTVKQATIYFLVGRLFGLAIPKDVSDFAGRAYLLVKEDGVSLQKAAFSVVLDRFWDAWVAGILIIPGVLVFLYKVPQQQIVLLNIFLILFAILLPALLPNKVFLWFGSLYEKLRYRFAKVPIVSRFPLLLTLPEASVSMRLKIIILSFIKIAATMGRAYVLSIAIGLPVPFSFFVIASPIVQLSFLLALTPGGLGITDATWSGLLLTQGLSSEQIAAYVVVQRVFTTVFILILGSWSFLVIRRNSKE